MTVFCLNLNFSTCGIKVDNAEYVARAIPPSRILGPLGEVVIEQPLR